jgi:LysR family hydrogen peroxide-inducible transcriptional activator
MSRWSPHPVTLRQLQYVLAVAEFRSFRRAAEACAIAQPSLSAQVAQLESALGVQIFERLTRGVGITPSGEAVLERARRTVLEADDVVGVAGRARDPHAGALRIGVIPTVAPYLLPEVAPALRAQFPKLTLFWEEEKTRPLIERIEAGALDAGVLAAESDMGDLQFETLGRDAFFLAVPKGHRLAAGTGPARLDQLDGETVLVLEDGHCFRDQALEVCHRAGADAASVRATSLSTLAQMVVSGAGITLLPRIAISTENRARSLVVRPFGVRGPHRTLALSWRKTSASGSLLKSVGTTIRETLHELGKR